MENHRAAVIENINAHRIILTEFQQAETLPNGLTKEHVDLALRFWLGEAERVGIVKRIAAVKQQIK